MMDAWHKERLFAMPFDGTDSRTATVAVIDRAIELLGPSGARWTQCEFTSDAGHHCILGALKRARFELKIKGDKSAKHIRNAIHVLADSTRPYAFPLSIMDFNDETGRKFGDIALVLAYARATAAGERPEVMRIGGNALYVAILSEIEPSHDSIAPDLKGKGGVQQNASPAFERNYG